MEFLYFLEKIRNPVLDAFFSAITHLGSETLFMALAIIVFWCVSKKRGYYLLAVGFFGTLLNQFLKLVCRVPRPWVRDPNFTIVESARADATGYSFPSGHTQSAVASLGCIARFTEKKWLRITCVVLTALVAFSRMYLGVHTPADVVVSLVLGTILVFALYPIFDKSDENPKLLYFTVLTLVAISLAYVIFVENYAWPSDMDAENLAHGIKNGYLLFGCGAAMLLCFFVERKYIRFEVRAPWWAQILKVVLGLILVMGVRMGLKPVTNAIFGDHHIGTAIRYFFMVVFAVLVWPLSFPWFSKGCPISKRARKVLKVILIVLIDLVVLAGALFWIVTRDTKAAPMETDDAANPLITPLGTTMLSGHRAGGGIAPENTMMALKNCVESDVYQLDIFEFDVHMTADGYLVLLHDETLDRTSNAAEYFGQEGVAAGEKTLSELKNLNMGETFVADSGETPYAGLRGEAIPDDLRITTLEEALHYLESSGEYRYIIEIKNSGETGFSAADALYTILEQYGCTDRTVVGTFHNEVTAYLDETYPDLPRSAGVSEVIRFYLCSLLGVENQDFAFAALQIPTTDYVINLGTSRVVNYAHENNIAVQYWTINDAKEMARLQSIGADAIMTDIPDTGAQVLVQP